MDKVPFQYLDRENVRRLAYAFILRRDEPWVIAVVAAYSRPELAREMLLFLSPDIQSRVALMGLTIRNVSMDQVWEIDTLVRELVDYIIADMKRLGRQLETASGEARSRILYYLKQRKPELYEELRRQYLLFEDLALAPDRDMQAIIRDLRPETLAKALYDTPQDLREHFFKNMSAGAASMTKELINKVFYPPFPSDQASARSEIIEIATILEREKKISSRTSWK